MTYNDVTHTATLTPSSQLAGGASFTATLTTAVKAIDGTALASPVSWGFSTAACPCTLFSNATQPASQQNATADGRSGPGPFSLELGVKITVDQPTTLSALRFYKSVGETGTHVGRIWSSTGTLITSVTFTNETASGWQQQPLASPLTLSAGTTYLVSVNANAYFVVTQNALQNSVVSGPLHTVADGANGVFAMAGGTFPTQTYASSNYFVDVQGSPSTVTAPTVTSTSPANGATGVSRTAQVTATFSRSMDGTTISGSSFTLTGPSGAVARIRLVQRHDADGHARAEFGARLRRRLHSAGGSHRPSERRGESVGTCPVELHRRLRRATHRDANGPGCRRHERQRRGRRPGHVLEGDRSDDGERVDVHTDRAQRRGVRRSRLQQHDADRVADAVGRSRFWELHREAGRVASLRPTR